MNVELSGKELETIFRGLMVLPWVEANPLIQRLQNIEKNERINLEYQKQLAQQVAEPKVKTARYGVRKDGTPRAKPGRKAA